MKQFSLILLFFCLLLVSCGEQTDYPLVINEICGKDFPDNEWVEICNPSNRSVDLKGVYLVKISDEGIDHVIYRFKEGTLEPGEVYLISSMNKKLKRKLSRKKELGIELVDPNDETIDSFYRDEQIGEHSHPVNGSYARIPNGTGPWVIVANASRGEPNPDDAQIVEVDDLDDSGGDDNADGEDDY